MALKQITIVGGGVSGLALGIALRRHAVPVRILEAAHYPRHRVCGEFISGVQKEDLNALGIGDLMSTARQRQSMACYDGGEMLVRGTLPEAAYALSRYSLDDALAERFVAAGGALVTKTRFDGNTESDGTVLACGRARCASSWLGVKCHYEGLSLAADLEIHLGSSAYVGLTPVENNRVNVCGLFQKPPSLHGGRHVLDEVLRGAGLEALAERLGSASADDASLKSITGFQLGWQPHRDGSVRIGDAAAIIAPFTGNGMTMALQGALSAAGPLTQWALGQDSWRSAQRNIRSALHRLFARRMWCSRILHGILLHRVGRRVCAHGIKQQWVTLETLYRMVR